MTDKLTAKLIVMPIKIPKNKKIKKVAPRIQKIVLLDGLKARGLEPNPDKFACLGTTPGACLGKPDWLTEPTSFMDTNGNVTEARGIDICNNPIGEKPFVQAFLADKLDSICCAIIKASAALNTSNLHPDFLSFYYAYQSRWDYWRPTTLVNL